jgi:hypothetical protein
MRAKDYRRFFKLAYSLLGAAADAGYTDYRYTINFRPEEQVSPDLLEKRKLMYIGLLGYVMVAAAQDDNLELVNRVRTLCHQANKGGVAKT